ncbi:hypothetical protein Zmor_007241 [Zophobas morio]|uniref:Nucleolar 27S pre-rRNA processing Urb2/Npa2 C-terminal domain-containing protein n=1 Tax=Zophobas morio TaxID=2755281 RepID=A0AA38ITG5_9CUCU|nr:hypothetical protein Zmor_007241 [Zophobas morio]
MFLEGDPILTSASITEEDVVNYLEKLKNADTKPCQKEITALLQNQNVLRYFKFHVEQYCELHKLIITKIEDSHDYITFLKDDGTLHRLIRERDDFFNIFLEMLVPTLIDTCCKFSENEKVFMASSEVIQKCVFSSKEFICYFTDFFEKKKCTEKHIQCKALLKYCASLCSNLESAGVGFKLFFYSFSKSSKNFNNIYKMLVILLEICGFDLKTEFNFNKLKYQVQEPSLNNALYILNELLDTVTKLKVDLESKINDITFSDFIKKLVKSVITLSQHPNICCYQILLKVAEINPLIIESLVNEILVYVMLSDNTSCRKEYEQLMIKIFEVFSKLHRTQNLISKMIPTLQTAIKERKLNELPYSFRGTVDVQLKTDILYSADDILPEVILEYFTSCIISLASWQTINLLKTMTFHLKKAVEQLPEVQEENIYVEILSSLTCWLLLSVRVAEHTVAENTVVKFAEGLEELKTILGQFGAKLLQREHNHVLMRAFLNISYYWAEVYMTLEYYSVNNQIKMTKTLDNNFSAFNLTYIHPYLSNKEWCHISERINNFGEKPCKKIMQKLLIQKLRAFLIFGDGNNDVVAPIIRTLSTSFDAESVDIFSDRFVVNTVLDKMPTSNIISLAEILVKDLVEGNTKVLDEPHINDSQLITQGILCVIFTKINKLLKQKRKHDDTSVRKALCSKAMSLLPTDMFLCGRIEEVLGSVSEILVSESHHQNIDLKMQEEKLELYLELLTKIPLIFCSESTQKLTVLLLMALHKDSQNCENIKLKCEQLIISIVQHNRFTLLDLFESSVLVKTLVDSFDSSEDLFFQIVQNVFKSDTAITKFEPGVSYIKDNLRQDKCLRFAVTLFNVLSKIRKVKMSPQSKEVCLKYKSDICHKMLKLVLKNSPEDRLIEVFGLVLKTFLAKDEDDTLSKLKTRLPEYVEYSFNNMSNINSKACLLLFTTILHNKTILGDFSDTFILRIWDALKTIAIQNDSLEEYSQLVTLITTLIANEHFSNIFGNLMKVTERSIESGDDKEFCKHLKTWSCILSTNVNPAKTNILREQLEFLLEKLILLLKSRLYKDDLFEEVIQFKISIIQANHVPLTASLIDFLLSSVSILLMKDSHDFIHNFSSSITLLENLLKYRNPLIMDRLPPYLLQYRLLLKELCLRGSSHVTLQPTEAQKLTDCAHKLEKLTKNLVECTKDMSRIAMYLIADILGQYELDTMDPNVKKHLNNCIYSLIALCDQHAVQYLMRVLSNPCTEFFKIIYANYKKYRFTGKI